jgi:NADH-ubiquinone oxidoreductase chain 1
LNLNVIVEYQKSVLFIYPLLPVFIIFLIGGIAETNRAPFDLAEAESELVSGFMTEHSAVIFVFFFLAEYASIVLICVLINILFFGGYLCDIIDLVTPLDYYFNLNIVDTIYNTKTILQFSVEGLLNGMLLGIKSCIMVFIFI